MGANFITYSARRNNCQDFLMAICKSNNIGDESDYKFIKQDVKSLFTPFSETVSNIVTNTGARFNTAIYGQGIKKANKWLEHVKQCQKTHNLSYKEAMKKAKETYKK